MFFFLHLNDFFLINSMADTLLLSNEKKENRKMASYKRARQ